jgi:hypothetical protein
VVLDVEDSDERCEEALEISIGNLHRWFAYPLRVFGIMAINAASITTQRANSFALAK